MKSVQKELNQEKLLLRLHISHLNRPKIGDADNGLKSVLDFHFKGQTWHFSVKGNIFQSAGQTATKRKSRKTFLIFYK